MWTASYLGEGEILQEMEGGRNPHSLKQEPTADTYEPEKETNDDVNIFSWVSGKKEVFLTMSEVHFFRVHFEIMRNPDGDVEWVSLCGPGIEQQSDI